MDTNVFISSEPKPRKEADRLLPARSPKERCPRVVAFLDIMGFKDMVSRQSETKIDEKLYVLTSFISSNVRDGFIQFSVFSDSIIIFSSDLSLNSFKQIVNLVASIMAKSISLGLPIKGAIASGECTVTNDKTPYYFGQPIIDAYLLEENVEMYGVVLHHTVESLAVESTNDSDLVFDYLTKFRGGESMHYVVNWFGNNYEENEKNINAIRFNVSDSARRYIDATKKCFSFWKKKSV